MVLTDFSIRIRYFLFFLFISVVVLVHRVDVAAQTITTIAGGGTSTADGIPATSSYLSQPRTVVVDSKGIVYISYGWENRIRKVSVDGLVTTYAGNGSPGTSGDGGPASTAAIERSPVLIIDRNDNLYLGSDNRVRKIDTAGIITTVAGTGSNLIFGDGGPATSAGISGILGLAIDTFGNLYVCATNSYVRKIDKFGIINRFAGNGVVGFSGDGGPATAAQIGNYVHALTTDYMGNVYIADNGNRRIRRVDTAGIITTIAGNGTIICSGDGGPATAAGFGGMHGLHYESGSIFICDRDCQIIRQIDPYGVINTIAGTSGMTGYSGDGGPAIMALLNAPQRAFRRGGSPLYVAEAGNNVIRKIDLPNNSVYFTQGSTVAITVCGGELHTIDTLLRVFDADDQQPLTWSIAQQPAHGVLAAWHWAVSSTGVKTPIGTSYVPHAGYTGTDTFKVRITDGGAPDTMTIAVTVQSFPMPASITGPDTICVGDTVPFTASATGVWSSSASAAGITSGGVVTGISAGTAVISHAVSNVCGTAWAAQLLTIQGPPQCATGVAAVAAAGFTLFPNPTNGTFTVQLPQGGTALATITDVAGRTLSTRTITHNLPVTTTLPPGIYLIHLTTATGTWRSKLIIE